MSLVAQWDTYRQDGSIFAGRHTLEIIDTQGSLSGEFSIDFQNGFELTTGGQPQDLWPTIQPKSCRFTMQVRTGAHYQLVQNIGQSGNVRRFVVKYSRGANLEFVGLILSKGTTFINNAPVTEGVGTFYDGSFVVTAVDGITLLQSSAFDPFELGRRTLREHLKDVFNHLPTKPYLSGSFFAFQSSWIPDNGTANFILNQSVESSIWAIEESKRNTTENNYEYNTDWYVLESFCTAFNMRCVNANGYYFFQQLENIHAPVYLYDADFNFAGSASAGLVTYSITEPIGRGRHLIAPDVTSWTEPFRGAKVVYKHDFNKNLLLGNKFDLVPSGVAVFCYNDVSQVPVDTFTTRLRFVGSIDFVPFIGSHSGPVIVSFYLKIKVGNNYWARELLDPNERVFWYYKVPEWTTTDSKYYIIYDDWVTLPDEDGLKFFIPIFFSTYYLSTAWDNDNLSICFGFEVHDENGTQIFTPGHLDMHAILADLDVSLIDIEDNIIEQKELEVRVTENEDNSEVISREIIFSTGPNTGSEHRITDDSDPPDYTDTWSAPGISADKHYNVLLKSLMSRAVTSNTWMKTTLEGEFYDNAILAACGGEWLWWTGRYYHDQHQEYWKGEFLQISLDSVSGTVNEQPKQGLIERPPGPSKSYAGAPTVKEIEITGITTNKINADTHKIPMPDTTGWTDERIRSVVTYNRSGNLQRYRDPVVTVPDFSWDNTNRDFLLPENSKAHIWHIFRIYY